MRKLFLLSALFIFASSLFAQNDNGVIQKNVTPINVKKKQIVNQKVSVEGLNEKIAGVVIGMTKYDLQSNSSVANRLVSFGDGRASAVWIQDHSTPPGGATRGTGYNHSIDYSAGISSWQYIDMSGNTSVQDERTGWPALMSNDTEEFVVSHYKSSNGLFGNVQTIGAAGENWPESNLDGGSEPMLWPRSASAGDNYYAIAVDDQTNATGSESDIDALHFYRSDDAGVSWSYEGEMPNFTDYYAHGAGDVYSIEARDNYVAVAYFGDFGDTRLWKSDDYGDSWDQMVINDFPIDQYNSFGGVVVDEDSDGAADTIMTTDNCGDLIIDSNGKVHVVFSRMRVLQDDATAGASSYFPATDWLLYWNEDMGEGLYSGSVTSPSFIDLAVPEAVDTIGWSFDNDGDGEWIYALDGDGYASFGTYYAAMASFPSLGIDADDNIFVTFSIVMEGTNYIKDDAEPENQSYRHVFIRGLNSTSGLWGNPICVSNEVASSENVFPTMAKDVGDDILIWYQSDNEPGLNIRGDEDPVVTDNAIIFKSIPKAAFLVSVEDVESDMLVDMYPNPTNDYINLSNVRNADVFVYNILGSLLFNSNSKNDKMTINISDFAAGTYFVKITSNKGSVTKKLIIK